ncbi:hypothetical protein AB0K74_38200 [Streptomyces sp. NPDC056159]|uniref:hypothetical protein n=1 Tax=Streptomyces sp. NPDC056159 TaxID=3155537 RepID=UPI0034261802
MYRALLFKVGTHVQVSGRGFGCVGTITRLMPELGMYRVENGASFWHVKVRECAVEPIVRLSAF